MSSERKLVGSALYDLLRVARWGEPERGFAYTSERLQVWDDAPAQPAMYLQEGDERHTQTTGGRAIRIWEYRVVVYHNDGKDTTMPRPADTNDAILGAFEDLIPAPTPEETQTLGGRVHSVKIFGTLLKDDGALDGQAMMVVPIEVIVP